MNKDEADAYYNLVSLLIEGNPEIDVDFANAYKYSNYITAKGHTYGTYVFAMLNEYQLGSVVKSCEITIEFFKQVAERNLISKNKFDLAAKVYKEGNYKIAALLFIELAEEGFEVIIN
jgi:TPR repeat protein